MKIAIQLVCLLGSLLSLGRVAGDPRSRTVEKKCAKQPVHNTTIFVPNFVAAMDSISDQMRRSGFGMAVKGSGPDTNYCLAQCYGDLSLKDCVLCYAEARTVLPQCFPYKGGRIFLDGCFMRSENYSFFEEYEGHEDKTVCNNKRRKDSIFQELAKAVTRAVASAPNNRGYARAQEKVSGTGNESVYVLADCWSSLNASLCRACLENASASILNCLPSSEGRALKTGCFMRYSDRDFLNKELRNSRSRGGKAWIWALIAVAATIGIAIFLVILFLFFMRWRRAHFEEKFLLELMNEAKELEIEGKKGFKLKVYSVSSIMDATNCFSDENKLGEGGYGPVYKGLFDGQEITIKRLSRSSRQGLAEFKNELMIVAKLQHTNLVQLLGFCIQGEEKMLVYEFMPHNSLDSYIFDQSKRKLFDWNKYFNIIEEIAQGILYLHKYSRLQIIHRDLKSNNILLDNNMNPKISDFGMARIFTTAQSEANTNRIVGTRGYMAPEYAVMGIFSTKSDVFSYGVLVLEIVSGRRSNSNFNFDRPLNLIEYAWMLWKEDAALELMHPTLRYSCSEDRVLRCINVALLCVEDNPLDRPSMTDVIYMLTSECVELTMPKQPAFCIERRVAEVNSSTDRGMAENHTINNLTMSGMTGR